MKDPVLHSFLRTWGTFSLAMLVLNLEWHWEETGLHKPDFANDNNRIHSVMVYKDLIESNFVGDTKDWIAALLSFHFKTQSCKTRPNV